MRNINTVYSKSAFWKILKRNRASNNSKIFAVKNKLGTIVHSLDEVLKVWRTHFSGLCTPTSDITYDREHFEYVNECVAKWMKLDEKDDFLCAPFSVKEMSDAISKLNI